MKKVVSLALLSLVLSGCLKTEILGMPASHDRLDTLSTKAHRPPPKPQRDTTERQDTARVPIEFDASVHDWNKTNVDL